MIRKSIIKRIYNGTCAVGVMTAESIDELSESRTTDDFKILGTGFLVRSNAVLTNRHVALGMDAFVNEHKLSGQRMAAQFSYFFRDRMEQAYVPLKRVCVMTEPVHDDIAICAFHREKDDPEDFKGAVKRLSILESVEELSLGEPVGVVGFPYGEQLHVDERADPTKLVRMGPMLQHGHISGFQPWQRSIGIKEILLDVRTIHGMSGSPVFRRKTGQVIGAIWGGKLVGAVVGTVDGPVADGRLMAQIPHFVFSRAVPLDWVRVSTWLSILDNAKGEGLIQADVKY